MGRPRTVSDADVLRLSESGLGALEIAEALGTSRPTVYRALRRLQRVRAYVRHDDVFPWQVLPEHSHEIPAKHIRVLSLAAKTGGGDVAYFKSAVRWADCLIAMNADIDYDPATGFREIPASADGGLIKRLRDAALNGPPTGP
ncbi:helix-turn-helix domain-containing protein [Nonomuraea sp. NN258]|uniref:helix-turn-helix domain-containing protein n=1 Tax=Nonomuraea antri TaxID=2730852 RepID=UPI001569E798|nr:helix-turn-helix domain-containing protein [Nonomuraea antri]